MAIWRCPVTGCTGGATGGPWRYIETAATVDVLVTAHARERGGELPDPVALSGLRRDRVTATLDEHVRSHSSQDIEAWLSRFSRSR